jgi:hypothetical protein
LLAFCNKCGKSWNYTVSGLIESHGGRTTIPMLLTLLREKCPSRVGRRDPCEIRFR